MTLQTWLWLDTFLMLGGGLVIFAIGGRRTPQEQSHTIYHGIVCMIAASSYLAMAAGQGSIILAHVAGQAQTASPDTGRLFFFARYIDWTFTTPLLLLSLAGTAMHSGHRRSGMVAGLLLSDVLMIVTSLFFGASDAVWIKWTWFAVSCAAFVAVYYVIWVPLLQENRSERANVQSDYRRNAAILSMLWLIYPLILAMSHDGLYMISDTTGVALIAIIDLVSKVVYGLLTTVSLAKLVGEDVSSREASRVPRSMAA